MVKVGLARCEDYDTLKVFNAVKKAVDVVGGIEKFVKPGMKVLLKPNLLSPRPPEDAVDTHPEVVRALIRLVKGASATPIIGDSPGGFGKNVAEVFEKSGMRKLADEEGVRLVKFNSSKPVEGIPISRYVFDCDCVISIAKFKTHPITVLTAAVKNTFGAIVGLYKAECHSKAPKEEEFARIIAKVHSIVKPRLNVVDAIVAMEGDGPSRGDLRKMNFVMAGEDPVAIDSVLAGIVGLEPYQVLTTKEAYNMGLGEMDLSKIEVAGDDIKAVMASDFKLSKSTPLRTLPQFIAKPFARLVRFKPYIDNDICKQCNLCKISCPVHAIVTDKGIYSVNYRKCIRCMCCHEVCPYRAIEIKRNVLTRAIWG